MVNEKPPEPELSYTAMAILIAGRVNGGFEDSPKVKADTFTRDAKRFLEDTVWGDYAKFKGYEEKALLATAYTYRCLIHTLVEGWPYGK